MTLSVSKVCVRLAVSLAGVLLVSSCTTTTPGSADPSVSAGTSTGVTPSTQPQGVFKDLQACEILDKALAGQDFPVSVPERAGGANSCDSDKSGYGGIGLALQEGVGLNDFANIDPSKITDGEINGRPVAKIREGIGATGGCAIALAVGQKNRAFMSGALATGTTDEACDFAFAVAKKVEPFLPKGN